LRILVADDLVYNRQVMANIFRRFDWHVTEVESAEEVLERMLQAGEHYDILSIDEHFGVNRLLGSEAIRQLRSKLRPDAGKPQLMIISCTGFVDLGVMADKEIYLLKAGADIVWTKPLPNWTDGTMQRQLAAHLESWSSGTAGAACGADASSHPTRPEVRGADVLTVQEVRPGLSEAAAADEHSEMPHLPENTRVLIADDSSVNRRLLRRIFAQQFGSDGGVDCRGGAQ
jgi:CheY-like chemotaxis protein